MKTFKVFLAFPEKWFVFFDQIMHPKALNQYLMTEKIRIRFLTYLKTNLWGKLQYRENVFPEFEGLHQFFREVVLYLLTKLGIIKPWTNIKSLSRFDLGLWQTSKWIFRKLQYKTIVVEDSQSFYCFPRKMVCCSYNKFSILKPWTIIPWLKKFGFSNSNIWRKLLQSLKVCLDFPKKWFCICRPNLAL